MRRRGALVASDDGGTRWRLVKTFVGPSPIATHPGRSGLLVVGIESGVHRTLDGGATWSSSAGPAGGPIRVLIVDPRYPSRIVAATAGGVFRSDDLGESWQPVGDASAFAGPTILSLALDPDDPERLFAGTAAGGVLRLTP